MDLSIERDSTAIGSLFQLIINDLKNTSPLWDDFVAKASKLHACLRAAIQAIASYLDAFQKIADAATNSRGASKEIGTALTRVCLRHKAVETRLKTFTTAIMDCLVLPLQDKIEDWKRQVSIIDKEHAKEYKRCRSELKKRSTDTLRLQKKARKGQADSIQSLMDSHMHDVTLRRAELEEVEKKSLRAAMIEERTRYCAFVNLLQPVVKEECEVMFELGHLQEAMQSIAIVTKDPSTLPQASEELIMDAKSNMNLYPESPGGNSGSHGCSNSLGSRKSSVCSISSINSSGSSGSPGHHYQRSISQTPSTTNQSSNAVSTWPPHSPDNGCNSDRPHTISSTYEKGHQRPALTVYTFQNPETIQENAQMTAQKSPACRPPLPVRCSSLERPLSANNRVNNANLMTRQCPSPIPPHISKELPQQSATQQPTYVNMSELANMAALKITNNCSSVPQPPEKPERHNIPPKPPHQQLQHQQSTDSHSSLSSSHISSPEHSKTLSLASHDSAAGTPTGSGAPITTPSASSTCASTEISTPTNNEDDFDKTTTTENTNEILGSGDGGCSDDNNILKITETDSISITNTSNCTPTPSTTNTSSPTTPSVEKDDPIVTRGSVLQKTSMFEKAAQSSVAKNVESIYGVRKEEKVPAADTKDSNGTRIARRSSVNSMKPPPPVRRSSSVTPSHNLSQSSSPNVVQQQQHGIMTNSTESLPPPPAYLLDQQQKQQQQSSSIKVSETVKALSALKHTPASPNAIRRMQSPQQTTSIQSLQSNNIYSCSPTTNTQPLSSPPPVNNLHAPFQQQLQQNNTYYCNNNVHKKADIPPPLPPPNPTMQQKTQSAIIHDKSNYQNSFRTANSASPNIYGTHRQMSSFRCSSPNGPTIVAPQPIYHANPPAQPKTNPNLIAQLNARINKQSTGGDESNIYGNSPQYYQQSESIYGRSRAQQHQLQQQQQQQQQHQQPQYDGKNHIYGNCNSNFSSSHSSNPNHSQYYNHHYREHHSCPPPLNNPPPPPIATMPKKPQRINYQQHHHQQQQQSQQSHHQQPQMYMSSSSSTTNIAGNSQLRQPHNSQQQYQTLQHPMRHKKQPPVPQRHSSVQQKIFVSTNPFIHTTTVNCNSSPSSPSGGYYHPHHQSDTSGGGGVPSGIQTMRPKQHAHLPQPQYVTSNNPNYSSQTLDKTGNSKVKKHEFLENLNAKLAKQGISNKAFAVRSLINSKALPDPRKCHESLMDQIKRGATLKRNQKINDRSAPKIH
ncbi:hypothetical protein ACFFRR_008048 [Megaselia abdita]